MVWRLSKSSDGGGVVVHIGKRAARHHRAEPSPKATHNLEYSKVLTLPHTGSARRDADSRSRNANGNLSGPPLAAWKGKKAMVQRDDRGVPVEFDVAKAVRAVQRIINCSDAELRSRTFILDRIREFGLNYSDWPLRTRYANWQNASSFGLMQFPTEFADFVMELSKLKLENAIEIGVYRGATSYFIAAVLQRVNPRLQYHMVDIAPHVIAFERFAEFLNLTLHTPATSDNFLGQSFDFVFIDADHSFDGALRDYLNVGRFCNVAVAFHDIHAHEYDNLNGGTVRMWKEFRDANALEMRILEFSHSPTPWMGLGLGVRVDGR
jgi:hypothetical protein